MGDPEGNVNTHAWVGIHATVNELSCQVKSLIHLLNIYTRSRNYHNIVFILVSYDRVLQVSTDEANRLIEIYNNEGIVSPTSLNHNLFTTGNLDNISILAVPLSVTNYMVQQYLLFSTWPMITREFPESINTILHTRDLK